MALIAILCFSNPLQAKFIVIDEVVKIDAFNEQVEPMGKELFEKTGINLYMSLIKETENNQSIIEYQQELIKTLDEPAILFSFIENSKEVQIYAEDKSLYELFDRKQIMDPLAIWPFFNGRVIPIIGARAPKEVKDKDKYAVAMFNGYAEISEQVADSKNVTLSTAVGDTNKLIYKILISAIFIISFITIVKLGRDWYRVKIKKEDLND
ncbi:MAG: hypothetical protein COA44_02885 [Arcobacter sp.]|nr:MAG: hypothetical protein COA44_02885 [Arcobacter sp.]